MVTNHIIRGSVSSKPRRGFTLLELFVAVAVITVVSGILLPALIDIRNGYNRDRATFVIETLQLAAHNYHDLDGSYPISLDALVGFAVPPFAIELRDDGQGEAVGYLFSYTADTTSFEIRGTPGVPSVTGDTDLSGDSGGGGVVQSPTSGATAARDQALLTYRQMGREAVAELILGEVDPATTAEMIDLVNDPDLVDGVADVLDANSDAIVTPAETFTDQGNELLDPFLADLQEAARFGSFGEEFDDLPGVAIVDLSGSPGDLFSYAGVRDLVEAYFGGGPGKGLNAKLSAAEASASRGNIKARDQQLNAFQNEVRAHTGKRITAGQAEALKFYVEFLKRSP